MCHAASPQKPADLIHYVNYTFRLYSSAPEVAGYSFSSRQCLFPYESINQRVFHRYTQLNCFQECRLELVKANSTCIPWDIVKSNSEMTKVAICSGAMARDFKSKLQAVDHKSCNCPQSCDQVEYDLEVC